MIVLAESNLVLELAFQQEQSSDVEGIVALAEAQQIELLVPACAFTALSNVDSASARAQAADQRHSAVFQAGGTLAWTQGAGYDIRQGLADLCQGRCG
jgi:hypothetical protein